MLDREMNVNDEDETASSANKPSKRLSAEEALETLTNDEEEDEGEQANIDSDDDASNEDGATPDDSETDRLKNKKKQQSSLKTMQVSLAHCDHFFHKVLLRKALKLKSLSKKCE